jgi:hypothetical protein
MDLKVLRGVSLATFFIVSLTDLSMAEETNCTKLKGCAAKTCEVEKKIDIAKKSKNSSKVDNLQKALDEINENCSDEKIIADIKDDIKKTNKDLEEHEEELEEAKSTGEMDKVDKYVAKVKEDKTELIKLKSKLDTIQ